MRSSQRTLRAFLLTAAVTAAAVGCASPEKPAPATAAAAAPATAQKVTYFMVVPESGRLHVFADPKTYLMYLANGEVPYTRTRIGAGPQGQTVVFGLGKSELKATPSTAEKIFDGSMPGGDDFYAEVVRNGRYHVFGSWRDFQDFMKNNEITYTFTQIGSGPKGESVIYALNKETVKKSPPTAMMEQFRRLRTGG